MATTDNLLKAAWAAQVDSSELRFLLLEIIGGPGQYDSRVSGSETFYLPLAGASCQVILTFADAKDVVRIEPGPAFDQARWDIFVAEVERTDRTRFGREYSFSSFRVQGSWLGPRSGVQILPPPTGAPLAPVEMAEHPFILEFPLNAGSSWPVTNFRRIRAHRQFTSLLNVLLVGRVTAQPRRSMHFWSVDPNDVTQKVKWVQEFYFAPLGEPVRDTLSQQPGPPLKIVQTEDYYTRVGHDGRGLEVPADLDDSLCCYMRLSRSDLDSFSRAAFWMDSASRQWTISASASFASIAIAIEALGDRSAQVGANARFRNFIERYAPGASLESRRREMYAARSDILHGTGLMQLDQDAQFGWAPPEQRERDLMRELSGLARVAIRNWLKEKGR